MSKRIVLSFLALTAACSSSDNNALPSFVVRASVVSTVYDGGSDDLLTGGLGAAGLGQTTPVSSTPPAPQLMPRGAAGASFAFDPPTVTQAVGSTFTVNVLLNGAQNVHTVPLQLSYDPKLLQVANVSNGTLLSQDGQIVTVSHREDDGTLQVTATRPPGASGISGQGPVVTLTFQAKAAGQASLTIAKGGAKDPAMQALPVNGATATVTIQ